jgi:large subunit ribosomal protein L15
MNGARGRSGHSNKTYFEGGQTPLTRRLPKKGFTNIFKKSYQIVNVGDLEGIEAKEIDAQVLFEAGLIHDKNKPVKILGNGELKKAVVVKADAFSKTAREKLQMPKA